MSLSAAPQAALAHFSVDTNPASFYTFSLYRPLAQTEPEVGTMTQEQTIPVVDMRAFFDGTDAEREQFIQTLGDALVEFGFVAVEGHGVPQDLLDEAYATYKAFFDMETSYKQRFEDASTGRQRGYTSFGVEHAKDSKKADLKEFFHVGRELATDHPDYTKMPPNLWPDQPSHLKDLSLRFYDAMEKNAMAMLHAISIYLGQDGDYLPNMAEGGSTIIRIIHYPVCDGFDEPGVMRAAAHEDINLITILPPATESGLELLSREGEWLPIHAIPGQMIMDSGDMLSRITNNKIPATTHRVVNPQGEPTARYSMPFFVHPHPDQVLTVLDSCVGEGEEAKYPPITADDFLMERLREIGLAKK